MTYDALIEALEKATGPDGHLDAEIAKHVGIERRPRWLSEAGAYSGCEWLVGHPGGSDPWERNPPAYTASLDAALTLVPDGYLWDVSLARYYHNGVEDWNAEGGRLFYAASVRPDRGVININELYEWDQSPTPALALCIASLKARKAQP